MIRRKEFRDKAGIKKQRFKIALLVDNTSVAVDSKGAVYMPDNWDHRVRKIQRWGKMAGGAPRVPARLDGRDARRSTDASLAPVTTAFRLRRAFL